MKRLLIITAISLSTAFVAFSFLKPLPDLDIDMEGDILIVQSDDANDLIDNMILYTYSWEFVKKKECGLVMSCQMDVSSVASGNYILKVITENNQFGVPVTVN